MSDRRLGIDVAISGISEARSQLQTLEAQIRQVNATAALLEPSISRPSYLRQAGADQMKAQIETLRTTIGRWDAAQAALKNYDAAQQLHVANISRVIAANRGLIESQGKAFNTAEIIKAQRATDAFVASQGKMFSSREIIRAQQHFANWRDEIGRTIDRIGQLEAVEQRAGRAAGGFSFSGFWRGGRTGMSLFDESMRGQRGAMMSTLGSGIRAGGGGAGAGLAVLGGVIVVGAVTHLAEEMGKLNEAIKANAETTGMSVHQYAQLQGALMLTGSKATDADASLRHLSTELERAGADPASRAAKALHAIGISQEEIKSKGNDTYLMLHRISEALNGFADDSAKAAVLEALLGRGDAAAAKFLSRLDQIIPKTQEYADAVTASNAKWNAVEEKIDELHVHWMAVKEDLAAPVSAVINIVINGLDTLREAASLFMAFGRKIHDFTAPVRDFLGIPSGGLQTFDFFTSDGTPGLNVSTDLAGKGKPHIVPFDTRKGGGGGRGPSMAKEEEANIESLRQKLRLLQEDYRLFAAQQDANVEHQKIASRIAAGDKDISPIMRAKQEYSVEKESGAAKIAQLQNLKAQSIAIYGEMAAAANKQYKEDQTAFSGAVKNKQEALNKLTSAQKEYNRIVGEGAKQAKQFDVEIQQVQNQIDRQFLGVVEAHKQEVDKVINMWGSAFDQIGTKFEDTMEQAIKSAFEPMKPEYWWTASSGPGGIPLMHAHRIDPTMQLFGNFGMSAAQDIGKTLLSSIGTSISKSLFGAGTESFGQGLAKLIGAGSPGGIFGTGLGAVSAVDQMTQQTTQTSLLASIAINTGGILANTAATAAVSAANSATSAVGAAGSAAGAVGGIGSFFKWIGGFIPGFAHGGIVPSAAGGWALGSFPGATPALLHQREMVLPEHISAGLQNLIAGGGGSTNIHFHGPADAPSISRWFQNNMARNSGVVRQMFHSNALTPRSL